MELLPTELREQLPKLYDQEKTDEHFVYVKYFLPASNWTWFVTEGELRGGVQGRGARLAMGGVRGFGEGLQFCFEHT